MTRKGKIVVIYAVVVVASVAMIVLFQKIGASIPDVEEPLAREMGRETVESFFPIEEDLELTLQNGRKAKLSDLKGEVTVVAQFFAVCPHCAVRNGLELGEIYRKFGDHPDFRIVCISVDPKTDGVENLGAYAEALGADVKNWWFASAGDEKETHRYLEEQLKFFKIRERIDPVDIASNGRFSHDLGFLLVDRDLNVVGKWPLAEARQEEARKREPDLYERLKLEMYERIKSELRRDGQGEKRVAGAAGE